MLKEDVLPPNPIQVLIDLKYAYINQKKKEDVEWTTRPGQYPILLSLPFICQTPNTGVTTTYKSRKKRKQVVEDIRNNLENKSQENVIHGHAEI